MERRPNINLNRTLSKKIVNPTFCETEISSNKYKVNRLNNIDHKNSAKNKTNNNDRSQFKVLTKHSSQKTVSALNEKKLIFDGDKVGFHLEKVYLTRYESLQKYCADPFAKRGFPLICGFSTLISTELLKGMGKTFNSPNRIIGKPKLKRSVTSKLVRINGVMYETSCCKATKNQAVNRSLNNVRNKTSVKKKIGATAGGYCMFYNRFGKCNKDEKCVFLHDPDKIAVCTRFRSTVGEVVFYPSPVSCNLNFLDMTGKCSKGSSCRFKHIHLKKKKISSSVYTKNLKESQEETNFDRNCRGPMFVSLKSSPSVKKISVRSEESSNADPGNKNATTERIGAIKFTTIASLQAQLKEKTSSQESGFIINNRI
ncbi:Zinc finger CCCH domain-containing protein 3 [Nymphon striatum]|nr:Zinc finger CCCH domain-containing protein 3 [Nymphon striatum]